VPSERELEERLRLLQGKVSTHATHETSNLPKEKAQTSEELIKQILHEVISYGLDEL
jgi:hypothetical protein